MVSVVGGVGAALTSLVGGRGWRRVCLFLVRLLRDDASITVTTADDNVRISFPVSAYWLRMISPHYEYEPELYRLLKRWRNVPFAFYDCGANIGYWSLVAASDTCGNKRAIAVEPVPETIRWKHSADESVPVLVKLDVEGMERRVLESSRALFKDRDVAFIYEDHGRDGGTDVFMAFRRFGFEVYFLPRRGEMRRLGSEKEAIGVKTSPHKGYNFLAVRGGSVFRKSLPETVEGADAGSRGPHLADLAP